MTDSNPLNEWWYAIKTYVAPSEEQLSAIAGEPLQLLDDSDNEWWYALSPRTELAGYIPALFIESTEARRARLNTVKNKQLTLSTKEDIDKPGGMNADKSEKKEAAAKSGTGKPKKKKTTFDTIVYFDDGTQMSATQRPSATTKRKSFLNLFKKNADAEAAAKAAQPQAPRDLRADLGVLRIHSDIWNLEATYRAVKVTNETTAEEVLRSALERFNVVDDGKTEYGLYLVVDGVEKRIQPHEFPFADYNQLSEKANSKIQLKKLLPSKESVPLRVYGDEMTFKTILIDRQTTVGEAVVLVTKKFMTGQDASSYSLREVKNGAETIFEIDSLLYDKVLKTSDGIANTVDQKFFLTRRVRPVNAADGSTEARVYSHGLDLDIAYRDVSLHPTVATTEVVAQALERFNSNESPSFYNLVLVVTGQEDKILGDDEFPLPLLQDAEKKNPTIAPKLYLRKKGGDTSSAASKAPAATSERIVMTKMPMRVYADYTTDGSTDFKTIMLSDVVTTNQALKLAIEKFKIPSSEPCYLAMSCDEQGVRTLDDEELPLLVRNEMQQDDLNNIRCIIRKGTIDRSKFTIRVLGQHVWPGVGYKYVPVELEMTAKDVVEAAWPKFKNTEPTADQLTLCIVTPGGQDVLLPETYLLKPKARSTKFALYRTSDTASFPVSTDDATPESRRSSATAAEIPRAAAAAGLSVSVDKTVSHAGHEPSSPTSASLLKNVLAKSSPLTNSVTSLELSEDESEDGYQEPMSNPLLADQHMDNVSDPDKKEHLSAMSVTFASNTEAEGTISPQVIRDRPHSIVNVVESSFLEKLNSSLGGAPGAAPLVKRK